MVFHGVIPANLLPFTPDLKRMKEALAILGRIDRAVVRPPLLPVGDAERAAIRTQAGLR